jgi:preprotein translocase subunit YajC
MATDAYAQVPAGGAAPGGPPANPGIAALLQIGWFVPLFLIIYMLLIRPQQQQQKQLEKMRTALKKGDRVVTTGGIIGTVVGLDNGKAVLRVADDVKLEFTRSSIVSVVSEAK